MLDDILKKADALVHGDRNESYGHPYDDYKRVSDIFTAITGKAFSPHDAALVMIAVKLARIGKHHDSQKIHVDSLVDLAGYTYVYAKVLEILGRAEI